MKKWILLFLSLLFLHLAIADPLPVDQAFPLTVRVHHKELQLHWDLLPGYALYRETIHIQPTAKSQVRFGQFEVPVGVDRIDHVRGAYQALVSPFSVDIPLLKKQGDLLAFTVSYQGCKLGGYCYAPVMKTFRLSLEKAMPISVTNSTPVQAHAYFSSHSYFWQLLIFLGLGILLAFTPCVLPMVPILSSIIVGHGHKISALKAFLLSLTYVLAMAITYAIAGVILALAGSSVQAALQAPWVLILFSVLFVVLALSLFGLYSLKLPNSLNTTLQNISQHQKHGHYLGVAVMGVLSSLIVSPCVTAPLVGVLAYITHTGNVALGAAALFLLGLGMGLPLLLVGVSAGKLLPKAGQWMDDIQAVFGFILLAMAVYMLSRLLSGSVVLFLWGALLIIAAFYFWRPNASHQVFRRFQKGVMLVVFIYGVICLVGAVSGHEEFFAPLGRHEKLAGQLQFEKVTTLSQLNHILKHAAKQHQPVFLDFSAKWCVECADLENVTFSNTKVQRALRSFKLVKVDLTANDTAASKLRKRFNVVGTPTLVFVDRYGSFLPEFNIVGFVEPKALLSVIARMQKGDEN